MNKILSIHLPESILSGSLMENIEHPVAGGMPATNPLLELQSFSVSFGSRTVLSELSFKVPTRGIVVLTGPKGVERTTLLRTLAGFGAESSAYQTTGTALYRGAALGESEHPELVSQNPQLTLASVLENVVVNLPERSQLTKPMQRALAQKLLKEAGLQDLCDRLDEKMVDLPLALQRHLSILREIVANPALLCIDEPTAGITDLEAARLAVYLRAEAGKRALLISLHNQAHVRLIGGNAVLIADGRMLEQQPIPQIFDHPRSAAAIEFSQTGKCSTASLEASLQAPAFVDDGQLAAVAAAVKVKDVESAPKPGKFMWLKRGMLAGTPAPGTLSDVDSDLQALRQHGITTLIVLTENTVDASKLQSFGIKRVWEPIPDMTAPSIVQGIRICKEIESLLQQGEVVAIQGGAGLGRTGTMLTAHLLWKGMRLNDALEYVRRVEPRWVQTESQLEFLTEFAQRV